ncbi:MAG: VanW family protein [Candidatus Ornithomonoglobus sp.]
MRRRKKGKKAATISPEKKIKKASEELTEKSADGDNSTTSEQKRAVKRDEFRKAALNEFLNAAQNSENTREDIPMKKTDNKTKPEKKSSGQKIKKTTAKKTRRKHILPKLILIIFIIIVLCCAGLYTYGCLTVSSDRIGNNVYIEDIDVGNLTSDEALARLRQSDLMSNRAITLTCNSYSVSLNCADAGLTPKIEDTVAKAMRYGKSGDMFYDGFENTLLLFKRHTIIPDADVNEALLREKITEFGNSIYGELTRHSLEIGDGVVVCTPGHSGFDNNTDAAYSEILGGLKNDQYTIPIVLKEGHPDPITANDVNNFVYCDPADAYYKKENGTIVIENEVYGRYLDLSETESLISGLVENGDVIYIPYYTTAPEITAEQLGAKLFNAVIGSYSTSYGTSSANRCANIANAASKINETVLMPGDVFSFNNTVGPRSAANGFYTAKEYVNGDTVDGIGGGTCQVSSTLYNAVLYSDLSIVSRTNHMFPVDYCPIGQDATVADTGVDFKFVNSMNYPIKISAVTSGYTVTVSIIGTERDDPRTVKIENTTTKSGSDTSVHSVRYVYNSAGELIQTDDLGNSYYMAHDN